MVIAKQSLEALDLRRTEVYGDDHCFFHVLALALSNDLPECTHMSIRVEIAQYIDKNWVEDKFGDFITHERCQYVHDISTSLWAGQPEIIAASHLYQRPIIVIYQDGSPDLATLELKWKDPGEPRCPIFILYNGSTHYDALCAINNTDPWKIVKNIKRLNNEKKFEDGVELPSPTAGNFCQPQVKQHPTLSRMGITEKRLHRLATEHDECFRHRWKMVTIKKRGDSTPLLTGEDMCVVVDRLEYLPKEINIALNVLKKYIEDIAQQTKKPAVSAIFLEYGKQMFCEAKSVTTKQRAAKQLQYRIITGIWARDITLTQLRAMQDYRLPGKANKLTKIAQQCVISQLLEKDEIENKCNCVKPFLPIEDYATTLLLGYQ